MNNSKAPSDTAERVEVEDLERKSSAMSHPTMLATAYVPDTEEERKLVRKIDLLLLPTIW